MLIKTLLRCGAVLGPVLCATPASATLFFQMNPNLLPGPRQAFIFGQANATGTVSGAGGTFNQAFNLGAQGFSVIDIPIANELSANVVQNRGFRIDSTSSISGYFLSRAPNTTDMTYLIDGDKLGTNYFVSAYRGPNGPDQISVQATVDATVVNFQPKGAAAFSVSLNAGQTYMYNANIELTGSRVTSDKPIAVFSGNLCSNIPANNTACDHIVEQMPSVDSLSSTYLLARTPRTGTNGDVFRVVATENNTQVTVNGGVVATLAAGDFYEGRVASGGSVVEASAKVLVAQYLIGQTQAGNQNTDPAMTIVPGADQWLKSYVFATPSGSANFPTDFISVVIRTSDLGTLLVDGVMANAALFSALGSSGFSFGNIDVSSKSGPFSIGAVSEFQLLLSGYDSFDSYFTYGGAAFSPGASPPPPPPPGGVPEPSTWAMMIGGFGAIGGAMRYRRRKTGVAFA